MALKDTGGVLSFYPSLLYGLRATAAGSLLLDAAGEKAAFIFRAPKAGNIRKVGFRTNTVTTGVVDLDVRLETIDASTGLPTGTLWGTNTNGLVTIADTDDNKFFVVTLTADATVAKDELVALVIVPPGSGFNFNIASTIAGGFASNMGTPYNALYTTSWAKTLSSAGNVGYIEYSDGSAVPSDFLPVDTMASTLFNNGSTPDERGNLIQLPFPVRCSGIWASAGLSVANGAFDYVLYGPSGQLAFVSNDSDISDGSATNRWTYRQFTTPVELLPDTNYRAVVKPTTTNNIVLYSFTTLTAAMMAAIAPNIQHTERTDAGSWTETNNRFSCIGLILDGYAKPRARVF